MPCVETIPLRELDQLMRSVPNFSPRGHGVAILCKFEYNTKDCDCKYCLHHTGRGRKIRCGLDRCVCPRERIRAGAASYQEVISETMSAIHYPPFIGRLNQYLKESEENPMDYRNEKHRTAFSAAIEKLNRKNYVSLLIDMGFSAIAIADRVGHESIDITYRYAHLFPTRQTEMADRPDKERMA